MNDQSVIGCNNEHRHLGGRLSEWFAWVSRIIFSKTMLHKWNNMESENDDFNKGAFFRFFLTYVGLLAFTHWLALKSLWNTHCLPFPLKQTHMHGAGPCSAVHGSPSCSTCWDPLMLCFSFLYFSPINERALRTPLRRPKMGSNNVRDSPRHVALHPSAKYCEIMNAQIMKSQASKMTSKN